MPAKKRKAKFSEPVQPRPHDLSEESERGCVLCAHAWIEKLLGDRLREYLLKSSGNDTDGVASLLESDRSLLGAFANRARMARALGIIGDGTHRALIELNQLRVHFAHHAGNVSLTTSRVNVIQVHSRKTPKDRISALMP
jgi:hypothetical protein